MAKSNAAGAAAAGQGQLGPEQRDSVVSSLLKEHPEALVVAIDDNGFFMGMPASIPVCGQQALVGRTALDSVEQADRMAVISGWEEVKTQGFTAFPVHLAGPARVPALMRFVDVRDTHGVFLAICLPDESAETGEVAETHARPPTRPRYMRWRMSEHAVIQQVDEATGVLLGYEADELIGRRSLEIIHPDDHSVAIDVWLDMMAKPGMARRSRLRHLRTDGSWIWIETLSENLLADPDQACVIVEKFDISEEMAALEEVRVREQLLHRLAEALPLGVFQLDLDRNVVYANERLSDVVGAAGNNLEEVLAALLLEERPTIEAAISRVLIDGHGNDLEMRLRRPDSRGIRHCQLTLRSLSNDAGRITGAIACVTDVTESVQLREELHQRATFDTLTRCLNRATVIAELERAVRLAASAAGPGGTAVIFVDLDLFKAVNDELGHGAGDELLNVAADRLRGAIRDGDTIGRIGGDEFLVIAPHVPDAATACLLAGRIDQALTGEVALAAGMVSLRASVGVAWNDAASADASVLVHHADMAMYTAKRRQDGQAVLYSADPAVAALGPAILNSAPVGSSALASRP
jgi:diguanylate cyclase (GGDEF)-like protein/PAS domain S-box-containing protein